MGWRAEIIGRRIREHREKLEWTQEYLAYVLTDISGRHAPPISKVDVSRRERGVRDLTVTELFLYALALGCGITDLLADDDGWTWITPLRSEDLSKPLPGEGQLPGSLRPRFRLSAHAIALTPRELRTWLETGHLPPPLLRSVRSRAR
jgi:transcriptional regulator with XRE-family HTH domain